MSEDYTMTRRDSSREVNDAITGALLVVDSRGPIGQPTAQRRSIGEAAADRQHHGCVLRDGWPAAKAILLPVRPGAGAGALLHVRSMLITLIKPGADIVEAEIAARKVVSVAHLKDSLKGDNPVVAALMRPKPEVSISLQPPTMNPTWKEASQVLENMMSKVLSQAQAARLLGIALQKRGISLTDPLHRHHFQPSRWQNLPSGFPASPSEISLEKEAAVYAATLPA